MLSADQVAIDALYSGVAENDNLWLPVLVLDLDSLKCVYSRAYNLSDWGCCLKSDGLGILGHNIALKLDGSEEFQSGKITGHKNGYVTVLFNNAERPASAEKRKEPRYAVTVPAKICDLGQKQFWTGVITDASQSGCRVEGEGFDKLPSNLLVFMDRFDKPVRGEVAWKNNGAAGLRLNWDGAKAI
ncbi:MAG: PilZ domain-containing protein [Rhodobacteraceae bacterium]|nr:PilZ domain-containing protein [Paracoccaceae bacterium]